MEEAVDTGSALIATVPEAFVFMKVGDHAGEDFNDILKRKNKEFSDAGRSFWGYGGTACHPLQQVQPFARGVVEKNGAVYLLMAPVVSKADPDLVPATEYSEDGVVWKPIPKGIKVTGSRYALVLGEIQPGDLELRADDFVVGIGPSRGKSGGAYLQGRIDKACLSRGASPAEVVGREPIRKQVSFVARLLDPYAVLLK